MTNKAPVVGLILAGGLAKRMGGGDKCLLPLAGRTLLQRTIERAQPQVEELLLNANGNSLRFARSRLPVIPDEFANNPGPLSGVHAGLKWMSHDNPDAEWLVSIASDTPFFPRDLVEKLLAAALAHKAQLAIAKSNSGLQPIFTLWHVSILKNIEAQLASNQIPKLQDWVCAQKHVIVEFPQAGYDPFLNINTPQDLYLAEEQAPLVN